MRTNLSPKVLQKAQNLARSLFRRPWYHHKGHLRNDQRGHLAFEHTTSDLVFFWLKLPQNEVTLNDLEHVYSFFLWFPMVFMINPMAIGPLAAGLTTMGSIHCCSTSKSRCFVSSLLAGRIWRLTWSGFSKKWVRYRSCKIEKYALKLSINLNVFIGGISANDFPSQSHGPTVGTVFKPRTTKFQAYPSAMLTPMGNN